MLEQRRFQFREDVITNCCFFQGFFLNCRWVGVRSSKRNSENTDVYMMCTLHISPFDHASKQFMKNLIVSEFFTFGVLNTWGGWVS